MTVLAATRHEHALAVLAAELSDGARRFALWVAEHVDWRTGLMPRPVSSRGMSRELRISHRSAKRHAAELKRAGLLGVVRRGPLAEPVYGLTTPARPLRWIDDETLDCDVSEHEEAVPVAGDVAPEEMPRDPAERPVEREAWWLRARAMASRVGARVAEAWGRGEVSDGELAAFAERAGGSDLRALDARGGGERAGRRDDGGPAPTRCGGRDPALVPDGDASREGAERNAAQPAPAEVPVSSLHCPRCGRYYRLCPPSCREAQEREAGPPCVRCGGPVEPVRHCYAHPTCYRCLPPPEPIPVAPWPPSLHHAQAESPRDVKPERPRRGGDPQRFGAPAELNWLDAGPVHVPSRPHQR